MPQCQGTINDMRTKGHGHKRLLADWRDIRDTWTQPGENNEESTLINLHQPQGQFPRAILRIAFNLVHKKNGRKRQRCICYLLCTFLSSCRLAVSSLAWKEGLHSPGTKPHSMPHRYRPQFHLQSPQGSILSLSLRLFALNLTARDSLLWAPDFTSPRGS